MDKEASIEPGYYTAGPSLYDLLKEFAKQNRKKETMAEMVLWRCLRGEQLGVNFRRQHIIGPFIADFVCLPKRLIIEIDGGYHQLPQQQTDDAYRTTWLESKGYHVIRFTNEAVICNLDSTITVIKNLLNEI